MRFAVLDPAGEDITDPDTHELIGSVSRTKIQVEVTQLTDKLAVTRTYRHFSVNVGGTGIAMGDVARIFTPPRYVERAETLKTTDADWEPLTEAQSIVKVGDPVVQIEVKDDDEIGGVIAEAQINYNVLASDSEGSTQQTPSSTDHDSLQSGHS